MTYKIKALKFFQEQVCNLDESSKRIIFNKIEVIKANPYRYKRVHSRLYSRVFSIRLSLNRKETRLVYVVLEGCIILSCLLARKKDYKDLEKHLARIKNEIE